MKKIYFLFAFTIFSLTGLAQEKLFSIGYGTTFVAKDSTTLNLSFDLNRIPGQTEKAGGYYFINELINSTKRWRYYLKPTMDVNIGSGVASSPNNIAVGLPVGLAYDFKGLKFSWFMEGAPELIADKTFKDRLYYFTTSTYIKYQMVNTGLTLNLLTGISNSNGVRHQVGVASTDDYGRLTIPVYLKMIAWNVKTKKGKDFNRINWTNSFKFNYVYSDNRTVNPQKKYTYFTSKLDFYLTPNLGLNVTYGNGKEEPLFKQNHAISFGISLAR
ncbi:hypothetical protein [Pedobacter sp.]